MKNLSIILPISDKHKNRRNIDRAELLIQSLFFFWKDQEKIDFYVVCPDDELDEIRSKLTHLENNFSFNIHFRNETSVHPSISNAPQGFGIAKHMLIKLAAPAFVNSDFYLIFDTDVVPCKFMNSESFIKDGRALTEYFQYPGNFPWYMNSAKVLGIPGESVDLSVPRLFVTPEILSSNIVKSLQAKIESISGANHWIDHLISVFDKRDDHYWTEYTLYDLHAHSEGIFDNFHLPASPETPLHCMQQGIWKPEELLTWEPIKAFDGRSPGYFMVLQSITADAVDFDEVKRRFEAAFKATHNQALPNVKI